MNSVYQNDCLQTSDPHRSEAISIKRERKTSEHQHHKEPEKHSLLSRSLSPTSSRRNLPKDFDVPFFTVARYRNPISPTTYELAAVPLNNGDSATSRTDLFQLMGGSEQCSAKNSEKDYPVPEDLSLMSSVEIAFGKVNENSGEWLGKSIDLPTPNKKTPDSPFSKSFSEYNSDKPKTLSDQSKSSDNLIDTKRPEIQDELCNSRQKSQSFDEIPVRGFMNIQTRDTKPPILKPKPVLNQNKPFNSSRNGIPLSVSNQTAPNMCPESLNGLNESGGGFYNSLTDSSIYDDASVTDAAEILADIPSTPTSTDSSKRYSLSSRQDTIRERSFTLKSEGEVSPQTEEEYLSLLHKKIAEAHEKQLFPLKEDLADWLTKLLGEPELTAENLLPRLQNGVLICRLADAVTKKAQEAKDKGLSTLEVPSLPYKIWKNAKCSSFFARDNVSNFLRFCRRLGIHSSLLFESEDLVCGSGIRSVVLCLLEVGRLAQLWWNLEPPGLVKLEKELDCDEVSLRSDSGFSNTSSPRESTLALHLPCSTPPRDRQPPPKPPRPSSAATSNSLPKSLKKNSSTSISPKSLVDNKQYAPIRQAKNNIVPVQLQGHSPKSVSPRGPKPVPPPKPASIKQAVEAITKRPKDFSQCSSYDRKWSGAQTNPTATPVTTPTRSRSRLPVAKTPRSSGRSTPNTTPTTPTHGRKSVILNDTSCMSSAGSGSCRIPGPTSPVSISRTPSFLSRIQKTPKPSRDEVDSKTLQADLDNRVRDIAASTQGICDCTESSCKAFHVRKVSDGTYEVLGKSIFVRLLKGKHVMVRVGGGWDTLEHYLLRHDPNQIKLYRRDKFQTFNKDRSCAQKSPVSTTFLRSKSNLCESSQSKVVECKPKTAESSQNSDHLSSDVSLSKITYKERNTRVSTTFPDDRITRIDEVSPTNSDQVSFDGVNMGSGAILKSNSTETQQKGGVHCQENDKSECDSSVPIG